MASFLVEIISSSYPYSLRKHKKYHHNPMARGFTLGLSPVCVEKFPQVVQVLWGANRGWREGGVITDHQRHSEGEASTTGQERRQDSKDS